MTTDLFANARSHAMPRPAWPRRAIAAIRAAIVSHFARGPRRQALASLPAYLLRDLGIEPGAAPPEPAVRSDEDDSRVWSG